MVSKKQYCICENYESHFGMWFSVEVRDSWSWGWRKVRQPVRMGFPPVRRFMSKKDAKRWIEEDRKPNVHQCGPVIE